MAAKKKILIVEDNLINREVLGSILSPVYEVLEAENGEEGLAFLKEQKAGLSLILLDIVMPVMDGYAFCPVSSGRRACPDSCCGYNAGQQRGGRGGGAVL